MAQEEGCREGYESLLRREIAAMLVHCVYFRDLRSSKLKCITLLISKRMGYMNERAERYGEGFWTSLESTHIPKDPKELKKLGIAFYVRRGHHQDPAPRLRGTLPYRPRDWKDNAMISVGVLPMSKRFRECLDLIKNVVSEFLDAGGFLRDICMADHSLGAGIVLLVGKHLVLSRITIDTHLFAPPLLALISGVTKILNALPNSFDSGVGLLDNAYVHSVGEKDVLDKEWRKFESLRHWVPNFYLNRDDSFCNDYIAHYKKQINMGIPATRDNIDIDEQTIFSRFVGLKAEYIINIVPSANLYVSQMYQGNLLMAHSLMQWHMFTDTYIKVEVLQPRLLAGHKRYILQSAAMNVRSKLHDLGRKVLGKVSRRHDHRRRRFYH